MSEYIFVTNIFEYLDIRIYSSHSAPESCCPHDTRKRVAVGVAEGTFLSEGKTQGRLPCSTRFLRHICYDAWCHQLLIPRGWNGVLVLASTCCVLRDNKIGCFHAINSFSMFPNVDTLLLLLFTCHNQVKYDYSTCSTCQKYSNEPQGCRRLAVDDVTISTWEPCTVSHLYVTFNHIWLPEPGCHTGNSPLLFSPSWLLVNTGNDDQLWFHKRC